MSNQPPSPLRFPSPHRFPSPLHLPLFDRLVIASLILLVSATRADAQLEKIERRIPPTGIELAPAVKTELGERLAALSQRLLQVTESTQQQAEVEIYLKAVRMALQNGEFYDAKKDLAKANHLLAQADKRLKALENGEQPWLSQRGLVVRGYRSSIDDSAQPYGLEIPAELDLTKPVPVYIWLHGRGDKTTDLHFIHQRETRTGTIKVDDAIVVHPFGRQCIGWKSAGEIDVLEVIDRIKADYKIDDRRIVLMGFSMGGAGVWHIGAHYTDRWVAMSPGAGFSETALYQRLTKEQYPVWYEQKLWGLYDVPNYTQNLFNLPLVAYSGELDKQMQAATVMENAFERYGRTLPHIIGPGMGHKYHPDSLVEILNRIRVARDAGLNSNPRTVHLQTRTLRYNKMHWVEILRLNNHWEDSFVVAKIGSNNDLSVTTKNVLSVKLSPKLDLSATSVSIDGRKITVPKSRAGEPITLTRIDDTWKITGTSSKGTSSKGTPIAGRSSKGTSSKGTSTSALAKKHGLQGPIDDLFLAPFLVVLPSGKFHNKQVEQWSNFESDHLSERWRTLFRGNVRVKRDNEVTQEDIEKYHLLLWGDPSSNQMIAKVLAQLPLTWSKDQLIVNENSYDASTHVPALIYPNPLNTKRYIVLNSGPTFREGHDRTNSLQNPKLPDWAVIDLRQPPSDTSPGKIVDANFFDEHWQFK